MGVTRHTGKIHPPLISSQSIFKKLPQQGGLNLGSLIGSDSFQNLQAFRLMPKDCSQRLDSMGAASGVAVELGEKALKIDPIAKISPKSSLQGDTQLEAFQVDPPPKFAGSAFPPRRLWADG